MKILYTTLLLSFFSTTGFAQVFTVEPGPIASLTILEGEGKDAYIYFKNISDTTILFSWSLKSNSLDPNWLVSMVDNNLSWAGAWPGSTMAPVAPLDSGVLRMSCAINIGDYGSGALTYNVWADGDSSSMVEVTYDVNGAVSVTPSHWSSLTISPNPARTALSLRTENGKLENGLAQVYDLSGKLLREVQVRRVDALEIKVQDLPEGAYLLRYSSKKGVVTRRFLKMN